MDPEACLQRAETAIEDGDRSEARAACDDYRGWIAGGGFAAQDGAARLARVEAALRRERPRGKRGPRRTVIVRFGDLSPEDYGGGALVKVGRDLVLEYTHGAESDWTDRGIDPDSRTAPLAIYRRSVPTTDRGEIDCAGVISDLDWAWKSGLANVDRIADCIGIDSWELLAIATDPKRAWALYEIVASYHGWHEIDDAPIEVPYWRVERRWNGAEKGFK